MRQIKFRLLMDGNLVGYEFHCISGGEVGIRHNLPGECSYDIRLQPGHYIHHDAKDQFADHKDCNSNEIYENDFIILTSSNAIYRVIFIGGSFDINCAACCAACKKGNTSHGSLNEAVCCSTVESLGSVHQHPEYLEGKPSNATP